MPSGRRSPLTVWSITLPVGLTQERIAKVQEQMRQRVLRAFVHRGLLAPEAARNMRAWEEGGGFCGLSPTCCPQSVMRRFNGAG